MKKILIVSTESLCERRNGVTIPMLQTIQALEGNVEVLVVVLGHEPKTAETYICRHVFLDTKETKLVKLWRYFFSASPHYIVPAKVWKSAGFDRVLTDFSPDIIHFDLLEMSDAQRLVTSGIKCILSINDSTSLMLEGVIRSTQFSLLKRLATIPVFLKTRILERRIGSRFAFVRLVTDRDIAYMKKFGAKGVLVSIPTSIRAADFVCEPEGKRGGAIFVGLSTPATEQSLSLLIKEIAIRPNPISLDIVGKGYTNSFKVFCDIHPFVKVHGFVENLNDVYSSARIFANPIDKPCGLFNKYLDAMSAGAVCVGFSQSFGGMADFKNNEYGVEVYSIKSLVDNAIILIGNDTKRDFIANEARKYVETVFSPEIQAKKIKKIYL